MRSGDANTVPWYGTTELSTTSSSRARVADRFDRLDEENDDDPMHAKHSSGNGKEPQQNTQSNGEEERYGNVTSDSELRASDTERGDSVQPVLRGRSPLRNRPRYRPDVDGLRTVAVFAVVLYHLDHAWIPGGFCGVDMFFVISGFVVSGSLRGHLSDGLGDYLGSFYLRRVKRLLPALLLVVASTGVAISLFVYPIFKYTQFYYYTGLAGIFGLANMLLMASKESYFSMPEMQSPFLHLWSLGVEEQFYLAFPLVLWSLRKLRAPRRGWALLFVAFVSATTSALLQAHHSQIAFYSLVTRAWELLVGAALGDFGMPQLTTRTCIALEIVAVGCICFAFVYTTEGPLFPFPGAVPAIAGTACVIWAGSHQLSHPFFISFLSSAPVVHLGKISYGIYLWHWPILVISQCAVGETTTSAGTALWVVSATLVASLLSYHLMEVKFQAWKPPRSWHVCAVVLILVMMVASGLIVLAGIPHLWVMWRDIDQWWMITPGGLGRGTLYLGGGSWEPAFSSPQMCYGASNLDECASRNGNLFSPHYFMVGDSHTGAWLSGFREAVGADQVSGHMWCDDKECFSQLQPYAKRGDVFVYTLIAQKAHDSAGRLKIIEALHDLVAITIATNTTLLLMGDNHVLPIPGFICVPPLYTMGLIHGDTHRCDTSIATRDAYLAPLFRIYEEVAQEPNVHFFRYEQWLCQNNSCGATIPGTRVCSIFDTNHMSPQASIALAPHLRSFLQGLRPH